MLARTAPQAHRSRLKAIVAGVVSAFVGLGMLAATPAVARADGDRPISGAVAPGWRMMDDDGERFTWAGTRLDPRGSGALVWCIQGEATFPGDESVKVSELPERTPSVAAITPAKYYVTQAEMAHILTTYEPVETANSRAALSILTHVNFEQESGPSWPTSAGDWVTKLLDLLPKQAWGADVMALMEQYVQDARDAAVRDYESFTVSGQDTTGGAITITSPTNAAGNPVDGIDFTAELTGPAVFTATGTNTVSGVTRGEQVRLEWVSTGEGTVTPTVTYKNLPRETVTMLDPDSGRQQTITIDYAPNEEYKQHVIPGTDFRVTYGSPELKTTATDGKDGDKVITPETNATVNDKVCYDGLTPGTEYTLTGTLMDKSTGKPVTDNGKPVEASKTFTPTNAEGCETVTFTFNATELGGSTLVAFEKAYTSGNLIAEHSDINDTDQTVTVENPPIDATPADGSPSELAQTGAPIVAIAILGGLVAAGAGATLVARRLRV